MDLRGRHELPPVRRDEAIRLLSALLVPTWKSDFSSRIDHHQERAHHEVEPAQWALSSSRYAIFLCIFSIPMSNILTVANFRAFISSLKNAGVDMSHVSISRSYAILVGIEAYAKTRNRGRKLVKKFMHGRDKALSREQSTEKEQREKERRLGELRQRVEKEDRLEMAREMRDKLHIEKGG